MVSNRRIKFKTPHIIFKKIASTKEINEYIHLVYLGEEYKVIYL